MRLDLGGGRASLYMRARTICGPGLYAGLARNMLDDHTFVPGAALKGWLELGRPDDAHEAGPARFQLRIRSQEPASQ